METARRSDSAECLRLKVCFFATLRPLVGAKSAHVDLPQGSTVEELVALLAKRWPELGEAILDEEGTLARGVHVMVGGRSVRHLPDGMATRLDEDQAIDVFPAVAGG